MGINFVLKRISDVEEMLNEDEWEKMEWEWRQTVLSAQNKFYFWKWRLVIAMFQDVCTYMSVSDENLKIKSRNRIKSSSQDKYLHISIYLVNVQISQKAENPVVIKCLNNWTTLFLYFLWILKFKKIAQIHTLLRLENLLFNTWNN